MFPIPKTKVNAVFIEKPETGFAPIFYDKKPGPGNMLSVNAGNSNGFWLGGGGINLGFSLALQQVQNISAYETRHKNLLQQVQGGGPDFKVYTDENPTAFSLVYGKPLTSAPGYFDGLCFVDIFGKGHHPHGITNNIGMVYVAPPKGDNYDHETGFLDAIKKTAENMVKALSRYNSIAAQHGVPKVNILRLCLYSSGIYNSFRVSSDKIALAIFTGLKSVLENDDGGLIHLEFPCSKDKNNPLFAAVKTLLMS